MKNVSVVSPAETGARSMECTSSTGTNAPTRARFVDRHTMEWTLGACVNPSGENKLPYVKLNQATA